MSENERTLPTPWIVAALVLLLGLIGLSLPVVSSSKWVGLTNIEIRFVVQDEQGRPVPGATIHIHDEGGGYCDSPPSTDFTLTADDSGEAVFLAKGCMCFGSQDPLEETFGSHLPNWEYFANSPAHPDSEPALLDISENASRVQRGVLHATLDVAIRLRGLAPLSSP